MGQNTSSDTLLDPDELMRSANLLSELAFFSYEDFIKSVSTLNKLTEKWLDANGKQLVFAIKKGTDSTVLWRGTVKIACVKIDPKTRKVEGYKVLSLIKYMHLFKTLKCQFDAAAKSSADEAESSERAVTASTLFSQIDDFDSFVYDDVESSGDCCICLERKPDSILPCAHSYCLPCIEQWNVNNKTCPICRENLQSTDDAWVISEAPDTSEVNEEIRSTLSGLLLDKEST